MRWLIFSALVALTTLSALHWRAQLQTQQKLDALAAELAARPAVNAERPAASVPVAAPPALEPAAVPQQLKAKLSTYVIETPDELMIEAVVRDPKAGTTDRLPDQPVSGAFRVGLDGTVGLGFWGSVPVSGLTVEQASAAIRDRLLKVRPTKLTAENLEVVIEVLAANSKKYYVITDGDDGTGEAVYPFPCTGGECVFDALSDKKGLPDISGRRKIWIARRSQQPGRPWEILPVDWTGITQQGVTGTNYQLFPGDRVYVTRAAD